MQLRLSLLGIGLALGLGVAIPGNASAGLTFTLTQTNTLSIGPDGGNYGTVTLDDSTTDSHLSSGEVRMVLTINPSRTGDLFGSFGFNSVFPLPAPGITISEPTNWTKIQFGNNQDGFGNFDVTVSTKGDADRVSTATFTISGLGANGTIANFEKNSSNNSGEGNVYFAAHLFPANGFQTGYVGSRSTDVQTTIQSTPEPSTIALTMSGIVPVAVLGLRRLRRVPAPVI